QSLLTDSVQSVQTVLSDNHDLGSVTRTDLAATEPAIHWFDGATPAEASQHEVSVGTGNHAGVDYMVLSTHTANGDCLAVREEPNTPTLYQRVARDVCPANAFDPSVGWTSQWPPR